MASGNIFSILRICRFNTSSISNLIVLGKLDYYFLSSKTIQKKKKKKLHLLKPLGRVTNVDTSFCIKMCKYQSTGKKKKYIYIEYGSWKRGGIWTSMNIHVFSSPSTSPFSSSRTFKSMVSHTVKTSLYPNSKPYLPMLLTWQTVYHCRWNKLHNSWLKTVSGTTSWTQVWGFSVTWNFNYFVCVLFWFSGKYGIAAKTRNSWSD